MFCIIFIFFLQSGSLSSTFHLCLTSILFIWESFLPYLFNIAECLLCFWEFLIYSITNLLSLRINWLFKWLMPFNLLLLSLLCLLFLFLCLLFLFLWFRLTELLLCLLFNFWILLFLCCSRTSSSLILFLCLLSPLLKQTWEGIDRSFRTIDIFFSIYGLSFRVVFFE